MSYKIRPLFLQKLLMKLILQGDLNESDSLADRLGSASNSRVTLILSDGRVIGDSDVDTQNINDLDNHANRPEVQDAF